MSLLIINTLPEDDEEAVEAIKRLSEASDNVKVVNTEKMNIMHCTGCKSCMFITPGFCHLKDDYKKISDLFFKYKNVIVLSDTSLKFIGYKSMRIFERRFPFAVIFCEFRNNSIRHIMRDDYETRWGLLYKGSADRSLLNEWLSLYTDHYNDVSLGAFSIDNVEELCKCIS